MSLLTWLTSKKQTPEADRQGETVIFNVTQVGDEIHIKGGGSRVDFVVEGMEMPPRADASFAVWALLPRAMVGGFNIQIDHPIDPKVVANAERLSQIWEMWVPGLFRSIRVRGEGEWSRIPRDRLPRVSLYSGGVDSTYSILQLSDSNKRGHVVTIDNLDYRGNWGKASFSKLVVKTDPLLERLNYERIVIRTTAGYKPFKFTAGFTLASCLFLLSDLFKEGTLAADTSPEQDMVSFPWASNHVTNPYFAGSDFAVQTVVQESRVEKLAAIAASESVLPFLSFCREKDTMPSNCGVCNKCVKTKAAFLSTIGIVPNIFVDNSFSEQLMKTIPINHYNRDNLFALYHYAKDHGTLNAIPGLLWLIEQCRHRDPKNVYRG